MENNEVEEDIKFINAIKYKSFEYPSDVFVHKFTHEDILFFENLIKTKEIKNQVVIEWNFLKEIKIFCR